MASAVRRMEIAQERLPFAEPFHVFGQIFCSIDVLVVSIAQAGRRGRGEASGVYYLNDDLETMTRQAELARQVIESGASREELLSLLPAGGARNAIDCALWELEAQLSGRPVWQLAGVRERRPLLTSFALGSDLPRKVRKKAIANRAAKALTLKLGGDLEEDIARVELVSQARPDCWIGVDGGQAYGLRDFKRLLPHLVAAGVRSIEQPLRRGRDVELKKISRSIPISADESVQGHADLADAVGCFDAINIQLDKCGGLTAALDLARRAKALGLGVTIGNMLGSSLAAAPAFIVGQLCSMVELDSPTFLLEDRTDRVVYKNGMIWCPQAVWGSRESALGASGV